MEGFEAGFAFGFLVCVLMIGFLFGIQDLDVTREKVLVEKNLAYFDTKTGRFVLKDYSEGCVEDLTK